jgi:hypothetical protein
MHQAVLCPISQPFISSLPLTLSNSYSDRFAIAGNLTHEHVFVFSPGTSFTVDDVIHHGNGLTEMCLSEVHNMNSHVSMSLAMSNFERAAASPAPLPPSIFTSPDVDSPPQPAMSCPIPSAIFEDQGPADIAEHSSGDTNAPGITEGSASFGSPISQLFAQAFNLIGGSSINARNFIGAQSDDREDGSGLLKSLAFGSLALDKNALSSLLSQRASQSDDATAALRRVLVIAPGYTQQAQEIVGQNEVTIVELPSSMRCGHRVHTGSVSEVDSDWQRLTRASVNMLAGDGAAAAGHRQRTFHLPSKLKPFWSTISFRKQVLLRKLRLRLHLKWASPRKICLLSTRK